MQQKQQGSITVYLSLTLIVMITLITGCIYSVKVEAGRFHSANAVDQAMFSLFAHYDPSLLQKYDLLLIDGSCGTEHLSIGACLNDINDSTDRILSFGGSSGHSSASGAKLLTLERTGSSVTGYTLATDGSGAVFEAQAIQSMYDTLGLQAVNHLLSTFSDHTSDRPELPLQPETPQAVPEAVEVPEDFVNPLPILQSLMSMSLLSLVTDDSVSEKQIPLNAYYSHRANEQGFGIIDTTGKISSITDRCIFDLYLLQHFSNAVDPAENAQLQYQIEYLIAGKNSDSENLTSVLKEILRMRRVINYSFLHMNPAKYAQLTNEALMIASFLGNPEMTFIIQETLAVGWAYLESIEDLHSLLNGNQLPRIKTAATWQVELQDIPTFLSDRTRLEKPAAGGLSYSDYLGILLSRHHSGNRLTQRALDMIEADLRGNGSSCFRMDHCIDSISVSVSITSENSIPLTVEQSCSYRNFEEVRNVSTESRTSS